MRRRIRTLCLQHDVNDHAPRPIIRGNRRVLNKRPIERLTEKTCTFPLNVPPEERV